MCLFLIRMFHLYYAFLSLFFIVWSPSYCSVFSLIRIGFWEIIVVGCLLLWVACSWFIGRGLNSVLVFFWDRIFLNILKMVYEYLKWYSISGTLSLMSLLVFNAPLAYCVGCACLSLQRWV